MNLKPRIRLHPARRKARGAAALLLGALLALHAAPARATESPPPVANSAYIDEQGATHVTRTVLVPATISPEAQAKLSKPAPSILSSGATVAEQRRLIDERQTRDAAEWLKLYPANVAESTIAGVPVRIVTPVPVDPRKADRVLINLHGGAFRVDTGSLLESIPIAQLTGTEVVSVLYRLAPEHRFPAAVDDVIAVYRELLKTHAPARIGLFGTSAGAILAGEVVAKMKRLRLPLPAALGIFSGSGDFSRPGDSLSLFGLQGLSGTLLPRAADRQMPEYSGGTDPQDPVLSPRYSDLHGLPPTLFITSTRDLLLSGTVLLHRAFLQAGNEARLVVYEALPHAFWLDVHLPESREAVDLMARFFDEQLGK